MAGSTAYRRAATCAVARNAAAAPGSSTTSVSSRSNRIASVMRHTRWGQTTVRGSGPGGSPDPQLAEVDERVARPPGLQEAMDRRPHVERGELVERHEPMAADGSVGRRHGLEASARDVAVKDDVHDVLSRPEACRRDRFDDRNGAVEGHGLEGALLGELTGQGDVERLPLLHPSSREQPVRAVALSLLAQKHQVAVAQERGDPDARCAAHGGEPTADDPNPRPARCDSGSSSVSVIRSSGSARMTSWAMRSPGSTRKVSEASVFRRTTRISPRYPESMSPGELTTVIPWRAASPERGWTKPACPGGIATAMPVATVHRFAGPSSASSTLAS